MILAIFSSIAGSTRSRLRFLEPAALLLCVLHAPGVAAFDIGPDFNHDRTRFPLEYRHAAVPCESCHIDGVFEGTPIPCALCHSRSGRIKASAPSIKHIRVIGDCAACHRPSSWTDVDQVDHTAVIGNCFSCHNNVVALGKHPGHIQSSNICEDCHITVIFSLAGFDHTGITGNCVSCHNGLRATGKHPGHMPTTNACEDCHTPVAWIPVVKVDHASVIGSCFSCHNGTIAGGKNAMHPPTSNDCQVCHTTLGWLPAIP